MVALLSTPNNSSYFCGGVLIGPKKILTAANCLWDDFKSKTFAKDVIVKVGAFDLNDSYEGQTTFMAIDKIIFHKKWNPSKEMFKVGDHHARR